MTRLGEGCSSSTIRRSRALIVYASNPMASVSHQNEGRRGLSRDDLFTVVVEHFMTDTARYADIVLPATMQTEHQDLLIAYGHLYLAWNEPAAPPPGECLATTEIFRRLARRMGLDAAPLYDSDEAMARQVLDSGHPSLGGISLEELKARGWIRLRYPDPFVPFASAFPDAVRQAGVRLRPDGRGRSRSRRRLHPVPRDVAARHGAGPRLPAPPDRAANHYFLNSLFANVPRQQRRAGVATLTIHPDDAGPRGISQGDEVRVTNARGSFLAMAEVSDRVRPGVVATTKGRWPAFEKEGATVNATVDERDSDMGGGAVFHDNRVQVEKPA
jgi:anaerobic selenocysteine-containing dehydrogenase